MQNKTHWTKLKKNNTVNYQLYIVGVFKLLELFLIF